MLGLTQQLVTCRRLMLCTTSRVAYILGQGSRFPKASWSTLRSDLRNVGDQWIKFILHDILQFIQGHDDEQVTLVELVDKMECICGELAYTGTHLKARLVQHFGPSILFTDINGKHNVVTFRSIKRSLPWFKLSGVCAAKHRLCSRESAITFKRLI